MQPAEEVLIPFPAVEPLERSTPVRSRPLSWLRRMAREVSHLLCRYVLPCVPAVSRPYSATLEDRFRLRHLDVGIGNLPGAFGGFRILFLSDIHAGPFLQPAVLQNCLAKLKQTRPDLIVITGDIISAAIGDYLAVRESFRELARETECYLVLGNHDHYSNQVADLCNAFEEDGLQTLTNRSVQIQRAGEHFTLAGVDDLLAGQPDLNAALREASGPVLLLSHNPDLMFEAARRGVDLLLAGHTHGGQIRFGDSQPLIRQSRHGFHEGRFRCGSTQMLVSRGMGVVGVPLRFRCDPEAWLLTLRDGFRTASGEGPGNSLRDLR